MTNPIDMNSLETKEILANQQFVTQKFMALFVELCETMNSMQAFEFLLFAWSDLAFEVRKLQPKYYEAFKEFTIPRIFELLTTEQVKEVAVAKMKQDLLDLIEKLKNDKTTMAKDQTK
jgi:uncharacterized coiled-coil protein SlyX